MLLSFFSWTVIINKTRQLYLATKSNRRFLASYDATTDPMELRRAGRQFENAPVFNSMAARRMNWNAFWRRPQPPLKE